MTAVAVSAHTLPESPSPIRIGALSVALTTNLAFFLVLSLMRMETPSMPLRHVEPPIQIVELVRLPQPVLPPPPMPQAPVRPVTPPKPLTAEPVTTPIVIPVESNWMTEQVPVTSTTSEPEPDAFAGLAAPRQLAILESSRPPYPPREIRLRHEGEVLLRIRIGADGRPVAVDVARSSGFPALDNSAARHVMRTWRFVPPGSDGPAEGMLPVRFDLQ